MLGGCGGWMIDTRTSSSSWSSGRMREGVRTVITLLGPCEKVTSGRSIGIGSAPQAHRRSVRRPLVSSVAHVHPHSSSRTMASQ